VQEKHIGLITNQKKPMLYGDTLVNGL